jgi:hypothetical protein
MHLSAVFLGATQIEGARRRKCLIWIKGRISALALAIGSGATVM